MHQKYTQIQKNNNKKTLDYPLQSLELNITEVDYHFNRELNKGHPTTKNSFECQCLCLLFICLQIFQQTSVLISHFPYKYKEMRGSIRLLHGTVCIKQHSMRLKEHFL